MEKICKWKESFAKSDVMFWILVLPHKSLPKVYLCMVAQYNKPLLVQFGSHEPCRNRDITSLFFTGLLCNVTIVTGDPFSDAITVLSLVGMASRKLKYNVFYLSSDLTWSPEQKDM